MTLKVLRSQVSRFAIVTLISLSGLSIVGCNSVAAPNRQTADQPVDTAATKADADAPPFFGTRSFNFYGGSGTGQSITIELDGSTTVEFHGVSNSTVEYRGQFTNPLTLAGGERLLIDGDTIYQIDIDGQVINGCRGEGIPCQAELYEVTQAVIPDGLYILGGTSQGLEVFGDQYRYYSEGGEEEWRPVVELTAIQDGVIFDGRNYWCINTPTEPGVCTENGWRTVEESLREQEQEQSNAEKSLIAERELSLAGFEIGAQKADVTRQFGQPIQSSQAYYTEYEYPGFTAWFDVDYLVGMLSTSENYCTPAGVCPGMNIDDVQRIYGLSAIRDREDGQFMEYYADGSTCWLEIGLNEQQVKSVEVTCAI